MRARNGLSKKELCQMIAEKTEAVRGHAGDDTPKTVTIALSRMTAATRQTKTHLPSVMRRIGDELVQDLPSTCIEDLNAVFPDRFSRKKIKNAA